MVSALRRLTLLILIPHTLYSRRSPYDILSFMRIFITGAAGYVGAMLADQFSKRDEVTEIIALDKDQMPELLRGNKRFFGLTRICLIGHGRIQFPNGALILLFMPHGRFAKCMETKKHSGNGTWKGPMIFLRSHLEIRSLKIDLFLLRIFLRRFFHKHDYTPFHRGRAVSGKYISVWRREKGRGRGASVRGMKARRKKGCIVRKFSSCVPRQSLVLADVLQWRIDSDFKRRSPAISVPLLCTALSLFLCRSCPRQRCGAASLFMKTM